MVLMLYVLLSSIALTCAIFPSHSAMNSVFRRSDTECLSEEDIENCLRDLPQINDVTTSIREIDGAPALNKICRNLTLAKECIECRGKDCEETDVSYQVPWKILNSTTDYLCSETGKEVILAEVDCWRKEEIGIEASRCLHQDRLENWNHCRFVTRLQNCATSVTRTLCGARAARLINNLFYHLTQPMAELYWGCGDAVHLDISDDLLTLLRRTEGAVF